MRYWSAHNPKEVHEKPLHSPKTTVWCVISRNGIIGPYFFGRGETVNAERYRAMLDNFFIPKLHRHVGYNNITYIQQDGATAHTARDSMTKVRELFPRKLISRCGDIAWPLSTHCIVVLYCIVIRQQYRPYKKISDARLRLSIQNFAFSPT